MERPGAGIAIDAPVADVEAAIATLGTARRLHGDHGELDVHDPLDAILACLHLERTLGAAAFVMSWTGARAAVEMVARTWPEWDAYSNRAAADRGVCITRTLAIPFPELDTDVAPRGGLVLGLYGDATQPPHLVSLAPGYLRVGRSTVSDVRISNDAVGRIAAILEHTARGWTVAFGGRSVHGVCIAGVFVDKPSAVRPGMVLALSDEPPMPNCAPAGAVVLATA